MIDRAETEDNRGALTALVFGGSGLVGTQLWRVLWGDERWGHIRCIGRRTLSKIPDDSRIESVEVDMFQPETFAESLRGDVAFICLGSTMKKAGSREEFWRIDVSLPELLAKACAQQGVRRLVVISSAGTSTDSPFYYSRAKAAMEAAVRASGIPDVVVVRPGLLLGDRQELRLGEVFGAFVMRSLDPAFKFFGFHQARPIPVTVLARAMNQLGHLPRVNSQYDNAELLYLGSG